MCINFFEGSFEVFLLMPGWDVSVNCSRVGNIIKRSLFGILEGFRERGKKNKIRVMRKENGVSLRVIKASGLRALEVSLKIQFSQMNFFFPVCS